MKRVLVVDDEMPIRSAAMHILRRAGYEVEAAVDGFDALDRLRQTPAYAVLLDMKMPLLDVWFSSGVSSRAWARLGRRRTDERG